MKYIIDIPNEYVIANPLYGKVLGIPFFLKGAHEYSFPTDIILEPYESNNETKIPMEDIDEAIRHCEEVAEENERKADALPYDHPLLECVKCAEEHRHLAEWLRELKRLRINFNHLPSDLTTKREVFNVIADYYHIRTDIQLRSLKEALDRVETLNFPGEEVFTADEVYDILVDIGQHDKQFALGETIKYSPSDVYRILKYGNDSEV